MSDLKEMWERGQTAAVIAQFINEKAGEPLFTRNSVIGKAHRMGYFQPPKGISPKAPRNRPRKRILVPPKERKNVSWAVKTAKKTKVPAVIETDARTGKTFIRLSAQPVLDPTNKGIGIRALTSMTCRAIVGTGDDGLATYCGEPVDRRSFCAGHCALYFAPPDTKRTY